MRCFGQIERGHHRPEIAVGHLRRAVIGEDDLPDILVIDAALLDLHRRQQQPLLEDLGRISGETAWRLGARFGHVGDVGHEREDLALVEDRLEHHVLRHVSGTAIRVVVEHDITRLERIEPSSSSVQVTVNLIVPICDGQNSACASI